MRKNIYMAAAFFCACCLAVIAPLVMRLPGWEEQPILCDVPFGRIVLDSEGGILKIHTGKDEKYRLRVRLEEIAPHTVSAILAYEDKYFYSHPGVNFFALVRAAAAFVSGGRRLGASTITMQVARLRYNLKTTTILGKLRQICIAIALEIKHDKQEILEAYLNLAPYGGNVEGIEAASRIYFNKPAAHLTQLEGVALAVVPQNPVMRNPVAGRDFDQARTRLAKLLGSDFAFTQGLSSARLKIRSLNQLPFLAPHVVMELLGSSDKEKFNTSINPDMQKMLESALGNYVAGKKHYGIENAAAMVVNCSTMEICALSGSVDFKSCAISGQVDGTRARRSPGSTLKPFIYALALEQGLIHPLTILPDSPRSFGGYDPENFDKGFRGPLSAQDALLSSRNVPAIALAEQLAYPGLYGFLKKGGVKLTFSARHYGLALALGGAEVTMRELAALYAALANQGYWQPLRLCRDMPAATPFPLLSPEAAWLTLQMLERPQATILSRGRPIPVFYKTGTSNGFRDAWTAGIIGDYVVVVWIGNFDNAPNPFFVGAQAAYPLFEEISCLLGGMRQITNSHERQKDSLNLVRAAVCVPTGDINNKNCADTEEGWLIPGISPIRDTGILRPVYIDISTGMRACAPEAGRTREVWWEFWPDNMRKLFDEAGIHKAIPPQWLPECAGQAAKEHPAGKAPDILLPKKHVAYGWNMSGSCGGIPLLAASDSEVTDIYWYVDQKYIGSSAPGETILWQPDKAGKTAIMAVDNFGRSTRQQCRILVLPERGS